MPVLSVQRCLPASLPRLAEYSAPERRHRLRRQPSVFIRLIWQISASIAGLNNPSSLMSDTPSSAQPGGNGSTEMLERSKSLTAGVFRQSARAVRFSTQQAAVELEAQIHCVRPTLAGSACLRLPVTDMLSRFSPFASVRALNHRRFTLTIKTSALTASAQGTVQIVVYRISP